MFLADLPKKYLRTTRETVTVKTIRNGPFKGRHYLVNPDGSLGRRVRKLPDGTVCPWTNR